MTKLTLLGAAAILATALATPAMSQEATQEPGMIGFDTRTRTICAADNAVRTPAVRPRSMMAATGRARITASVRSAHRFAGSIDPDCRTAEPSRCAVLRLVRLFRGARLLKAGACIASGREAAFLLADSVRTRMSSQRIRVMCDWPQARDLARTRIARGSTGSSDACQRSRRHEQPHSRPLRLLPVRPHGHPARAIHRRGICARAATMSN